MQWWRKENWMAAAEVIDALRIFPRILVLSYGWFVGYTTIYSIYWYAALPAAERTVEVTAFYTMQMGSIGALAAYIFKVYTDGGYDWEKYHARFQHPRLPVCGPANPAG